MLTFLSVFSFNSLQAGKSIQTNIEEGLIIGGTEVSIPFKRESPSKQSIELSLEALGGTCFNSLQAGKSIQTSEAFEFTVGNKEVSIPFKRESPSKLEQHTNIGAADVVFQFPSSGKVHPNKMQGLR